MSIITSLSAYYKLDGNPYASWGTNNGTNNGGITYGPGKIDQAAIFNGTTAFVGIPSSADFTFGSGDFGVSVWFKRSNSLTTRQTILGDCNSSYSNSTATIQLSIQNNYINGYFFSGSSFYSITDTTTITDTNWHHVVYTKSGNTLYLYVDSVLKFSLSLPPGILCNNSITRMSLGTLGEANNFYFSGTIDEIGFWKQSLIPYVSDLYNAGAGITYPFNTNLGNLNYLIVGGGGQGGSPNGGTAGGGGGAGGLLTGLMPLSGAGIYPVVVGLGGQSTNYISANGGDSTFNGLIALGGGRGRYYNDNLLPTVLGGSGGGGAGWTTFKTANVGSLGQGTTGGDAYPSTGSPTGPGGGGGGSLTNGLIYSVWNGGAGGNGTLNSITGTSVYYAAGGGGGGGSLATGGIGGLGGNGIGGNGGTASISGGYGSAGVANTGSGGGGNAIVGGPTPGGYGGNGIVVLSYPTGSLDATGGIVNTVGGNTVHVFLTSGDFIILAVNSNFLSMF